MRQRGGEFKGDFMEKDKQLENIESGGGSGGGGLAALVTENSHSHDGTYSITANKIDLTARPPLPPAPPEPSVIQLVATGMGMDGRVEVRGSQGVRITAGPPPLPPTANQGIDGVEIMTGEMEMITLQRGLIPGVDQTILMAPELINIDGGAGPVIIESLTEITLAVAGGVSSITLTPAGIILTGPIIMIN
jgi:hypothetical protein